MSQRARDENEVWIADEYERQQKDWRNEHYAFPIKFIETQKSKGLLES
jgi:hypothetical protein